MKLEDAIKNVKFYKARKFENLSEVELEELNLSISVILLFVKSSEEMFQFMEEFNGASFKITVEREQ
jgi:hypothetical protein